MAYTTQVGKKSMSLSLRLVLPHLCEGLALSTRRGLKRRGLPYSIGLNSPITKVRVEAKSVLTDTRCLTPTRYYIPVDVAVEVETGAGGGATQRAKHPVALFRSVTTYGKFCLF